MDRSLDETMADRPRPYRGSRDRRQNNRPRDGVRKSRRDDSRNLDRDDWVHDRYEDDYDSRPAPRNSRGPRIDRYAPEEDKSQTAKVRVENLHYELGEDDLQELFTRIAPVRSVQLVYDRSDRSTGVAFVTYPDLKAAQAAIRQFDGANAKGQPIRLTLVPQAPAPSAKKDLFDRMEKPTKSLFERVERDERSLSPGRERPRRSDTTKPPPENIDRYVPGQSGGRGRDNAPRNTSGRGRRPGGRREMNRQNARDDPGRSAVPGRPRKTMQELDAEMADYWGPKEQAAAAAAAAAAGEEPPAPLAPAAPADKPAGGPGDDDIDMIL